jgi:hypothetical protein
MRLYVSHRVWDSKKEKTDLWYILVYIDSYTWGISKVRDPPLLTLNNRTVTRACRYCIKLAANGFGGTKYLIS